MHDAMMDEWERSVASGECGARRTFCQPALHAARQAPWRMECHLPTNLDSAARPYFLRARTRIHVCEKQD